MPAVFPLVRVIHPLICNQNLATAHNRDAEVHVNAVTERKSDLCALKSGNTAI